MWRHERAIGALPLVRRSAKGDAPRVRLLRHAGRGELRARPLPGPRPRAAPVPRDVRAGPRQHQGRRARARRELPDGARASRRRHPRARLRGPERGPPRRASQGDPPRALRGKNRRGRRGPAAGGILMSPELTDLVERRFQVDGPARLRVENSSGETHVRGGANGEVVVGARKRTHSGSAEGQRRLLENLEVEIEQEGNEIRISQRAFMLERGWANVFREHRASVDYEIEVPRGSLVQVRAASGEIEVHATEGAVELQSVSGDINVSDARGSSRLRTVSGDI